ncbi:MAG: FAD-dependent oxidoreductase, partial [Desulfobacterales bacterium]|nr:FAD-dependent oxidoreductase [Desulfobacterales bacterium]
EPAMRVMRQLTGLGSFQKEVPEKTGVSQVGSEGTLDTEFLVIGGGPAGMQAAIEAGQKGVNCVIIDDKDIL